jgi:alkane 1-monooxygenase
MASFCVASVFLHLIRRRGERKAMVSPHKHAHYIAAQKLGGRPLPVIARYALVTLIPALLIALGATVWGFAGALALIWLTLIAAGLDHLLEPPQHADADHSPWSERLALGLAVAHLVLLVLVLDALTSGRLSTGQSIILILALASFMGQVSHPNAHELIHRKDRIARGLGALVYGVTGFGHHVSAHRLVHHRHVGTIDDPNTPLPGEGFWAYLPRAWTGSFVAGLASEADRLTRKGRRAHILNTPYAAWIGLAVGAMFGAIWIGGFWGAVVLLFLWVMFGVQILISDYIQHYGLARLALPNGRREAVAPHHSWNAPRGFSSYLMMNAPSHSEHHMHPDRPYDRLDTRADVPMLPHALPVMAVIAMLPRVWRRMMDRRAQKVMDAARARLAQAAP